MAARTDENGRAHKQSQLHTQLYVNRRRAVLTTAVLDALPSLRALQPALTSVSPLEAERFTEYHDRDSLAALGRSDLAAALADYWPSGGLAGTRWRWPATRTGSTSALCSWRRRLARGDEVEDDGERGKSGSASRGG